MKVITMAMMMMMNMMKGKIMTAVMDQEDDCGSVNFGHHNGNEMIVTLMMTMTIRMDCENHHINDDERVKEIIRIIKAFSCQV